MLDSLFVATLNHLLADADWARQRLSPHAGRPAQVTLGERAFTFTIDADGYLAEATSLADPDVSIALPMPTPGELSDGLDGLIRRARINGHAEMADALGFVFRHLRWDAEGDLARLVGDIAAHRLYGAVQSIARWPGRLADAVGGNLREFIGEGAAPVVAHPAQDERTRALQVLRDDVARLEKRIERIERRTGGK